MTSFSPFDFKRTSVQEQVMSWNEMAQLQYDKNNVDAFTRTRVILMNGIENNSVMTSHAIARMIQSDEVKEQLALIRRVDSQQQQAVEWLNPANQTIAETTIGYEQVAVELTANLAKNEPDLYFKQVLDFALLEDFDHLFRYGCLLELLHGINPNDITQGKTEVKPGRPTMVHHRSPHESVRKHYNKDRASIKTKMNYHTIVSAEQQTMLYYKTHGNMYEDQLARELYAEIADVEQDHVSQYEWVGDPRETPLEKLALIQLNEAYNYYSCAETETDDRIKRLWQRFCEMEVEHFQIINQLMQKYERRDMRSVMKSDWIDPLIVFESNKDYVNRILDTQVDWQPYNKEFVPESELPADWPSFDFRERVNIGGVPSEQVVEMAREQNKLPLAA